MFYYWSVVGVVLLYNVIVWLATEAGHYSGVHSFQSGLIAIIGLALAAGIGRIDSRLREDRRKRGQTSE